MTNFRTIAALTVISACALAAMSTASAQTLAPTRVVAPVAQIDGFARCPKSPDQYVDTMKQLVSAAAKARTLADENPLLEPDAAFYEAELAATKRCAPTVAALVR
jgi:hypothetical protein